MSQSIHPPSIIDSSQETYESSRECGHTWLKSSWNNEVENLEQGWGFGCGSGDKSAGGA